MDRVEVADIDASLEREFTDYVVARRRELVRFAFLLTADAHRAEDVLQDVLARIALRWRHVRGVDDLDAYVRRAIVNTVVSWRRRRSSYEVVQGEFADGALLAPEQADGDEVLLAALRELAPRQRATVVLRYFADYSEAQTAEALGCSVGTVKSQTARGLAHLRDRLTPTHAEGLR